MSKFTSQFKANVAMEVVKSRGDIEKVSKDYEVPTALVHEWHEELLERASELFKVMAKSDD